MLTSLDFLQVGKEWPPKGEMERLNKYSQNKHLFAGKHELVYGQWLKLVRQDIRATLEIVLNFPKRLSTLWGDLLLGEPPVFQAGKAGGQEQAAIDRIVEENQLVNVAYEVAIDLSRYGTGIFKIRYDGSQAIVESQPPQYWFPVVDPANLKQVQYHVLAWTYNESEDGRTKTLRVEIHERGRIITREYVIKDGKIYSPSGMENSVSTGMQDFLLVPVQSVVTSDDFYGADDYQDIDGVLQELETRIAQVARILDKHAEPSMSGPYSAVTIDPDTGEARYDSGLKYFPVDDGAVEPKYITWDGQLKAAFEELSWLIDRLYTLSETCPAAFGDLKQGLAESGSALRRLMMAPLAKVNRIRMRFDPALKLALWLACQLEKGQGKAGAIAVENINITWLDGLPLDDKEQGELVSGYVDSGLMSREMALKRLFNYDDETLQAELLRIENDANAEIPAVYKTPLSQFMSKVGQQDRNQDQQSQDNGGGDNLNGVQ